MKFKIAITENKITDLDLSPNSNNGNNFTDANQSSEGLVSTQESTTKMVDDGDIAKSQMKMPIRLDAGLLSTASTGFMQDIKTFLAKPYPVSFGTFQSTDTTGTFPKVRVLESLLALDIYRSKIKGHLGIRATVELRIQFNADRFMQGRYILAFMPLVSTNGPTGYQNSVQKSRQLSYNRTTVTQLPHVEFDLNCDTEAILEIPYVSPYSHFCLADNTGEVGTYFIYPYSALKVGSAGSTVCQYTLWASLKDVELVAPTLPQMAKGAGGLRPAGRVTKRGTVTELEQKANGIGPVESVLNQVSRAADVVSAIPVISIVASQVKWATAIAAKAAHVFGWSKPMDLDHACRMYHNYAPFWTNADTVDMSMPISWISTNSIETLPGFAGTDVDETGIDFIKTIPAFVEECTWSKSANTDDIIYTTQIFPRNYTTYGVDSGKSVITQTPVSFLGGMFQNYRGSLRFVFKVVKTEFHSGRLLLLYAPSQAPTTGNISTASSSYLHREVLDVKMGSEFSFVIPYASLQTYRDCAQSYGRLQLIVLNELVAPDTASASVTILVEVSGAPDLEFSVPTVPKLMPMVPFATQMGAFDYQMGEEDGCVIDQGIISNAAMFDDHLSGARFCNGEKIMSLMQLLKGACATNTFESATNSEMQVFPWNSAVVTGNGTVTTSIDYLIDWYDYIVHCYALSRGGMRLKLIKSNDNSFDVATVRLCCANQLTSNAPKRWIFGGPGTFMDLANYWINTTPFAIFKSNQAPVEVQVPQYGRFHSRVNSELMNGGNTSTSFSSGSNYTSTKTPPTTFVNFSTSGNNYSNVNTTLYRSVSDDFQLGYFVGVPPMTNFA